MEKDFDNNLWWNIKAVFVILFAVLFPFIICLLPIIPYGITDNPLWLISMILTVPIGIAYGIYMWEGDFLERNLFKEQ